MGTNDGPVEMVVQSVGVRTLSNEHVVILREARRERYLLIWIGQGEANSIAMGLQGASPGRPLTHDTFVATLELLGARMSRVVISDLADETFHARIHLVLDGRELEVDSRPSDAIALAVRTGVRIYADRSVLDRAGVQLASDGEKLEVGIDRPSDEHLSVFRDFVNSLDIDVESDAEGDAENEPREGPNRES